MRTAALAVLVASAVLVAGCGGASSNGEAKKTPAQVLSDTKAAAISASGVHVAGTIVTAGNPLSLDLTIVSGKGGKGTLSEGGLGFELVSVGGKAYIRGSDAFYRKFAGAAAAALLRGKWLAGSATSGQFKTLGDITNIRSLMTQVTTQTTHGKLANDGETTYRGQRVDVIRDTSDGSRLYVAATGKPYPVAIVGGKTGDTGTVTFDRWNATVALTAPTGAIDLSKLQGG